MNNTNTIQLARTTGLDTFTPEMGQARPADAVIDARLAYNGGWTLKTPLTLSGRGVKFLGKLLASQLTPQAQNKAGWNEYRVSANAFKAICEQHKVASESLL